MCFGFTLFCVVCIFRPEYLASTYNFIREKYSPKVTLLFRILAFVSAAGGVQMSINVYKSDHAFSPQPPNLMISAAVGFGLGLFCVAFVRWGRKRKLARKI